ncbi:hypothetical protein NECAME_03768 [Necator americanus]|uniref:Globin n=1 Tax=Necator americanus TaxID=51031 RepID=W2T2E2_NECAM|nr:hypothetical protein NECAME_03768 [Necator americanus]ETN75386.1 hypothetical protein NECAME_03768 [Necator americanus]
MIACGYGVIYYVRAWDSYDSMRERSGSIPSTRAMLPICPSLTPSQVAAIRRSWKHINTKGLLESSCPVAQLCFASSLQSLSIVRSPIRTVTDHARYMLSLLDRIIDAAQDLEEIREVGARHVILKQGCGLGPAELDKFQEIFVEVILKQDGVRQSKEASRAWRILICAFVDLFRDGFEMQLRQFRRKHSFNAHTQYFENIERSPRNPKISSELTLTYAIKNSSEKLKKVPLRSVLFLSSRSRETWTNYSVFRRASQCPSRKASLNVDPRLNNCSRRISQLNI